MNAAGVRHDDLAVVVDGSVAKQGKYLPGSQDSRRGARAPAVVRRRPVLILPWNIAPEVTPDHCRAGAEGALLDRGPGDARGRMSSRRSGRAASPCCAGAARRRPGPLRGPALDEARVEGARAHVDEVIDHERGGRHSPGLHYQAAPFEEAKTLGVTGARPSTLWSTCASTSPPTVTSIGVRLASTDDLALHIRPGWHTATRRSRTTPRLTYVMQGARLPRSRANPAVGRPASRHRAAAAGEPDLREGPQRVSMAAGVSDRVLLTGATGLVGVWVVRHWPTTAPALVPIGSADADLLRPGTAARLLEREAPTDVIHLAWSASGQTRNTGTATPTTLGRRDAGVGRGSRGGRCASVVDRHRRRRLERAVDDGVDAYARSKARAAPDCLGRHRRRRNRLAAALLRRGRASAPTGVGRRVAGQRQRGEPVALHSPGAVHDFVHASDVGARWFAPSRSGLRVTFLSGPAGCAGSATWSSPWARGGRPRQSITETAHDETAADTRWLTRPRLDPYEDTGALRR